MDWIKNKIEVIKKWLGIKSPAKNVEESYIKSDISATKELLRQEMILNHRRMWTWIVDAISIRNEFVGPKDYFKEHPDAEKGEFGNIYDDCYLCHYTLYYSGSKNPCELCPICPQDRTICSLTRKAFKMYEEYPDLNTSLKELSDLAFAFASFKESPPIRENISPLNKKEEKEDQNMMFGLIVVFIGLAIMVYSGKK